MEIQQEQKLLSLLRYQEVSHLDSMHKNKVYFITQAICYICTADISMSCITTCPRPASFSQLTTKKKPTYTRDCIIQCLRMRHLLISAPAHCKK